MDTSKLKQINDELANARLADAKHTDVVRATTQVGDNVLLSAISLIKYLEGHVTKTEVTNQLTEIGTPDALVVAKAVDSLHETLKTHENVDLSELTKVMSSILEEAKKLPKEINIPEVPEQMDHTENFDKLTEAVKAVEKVVKEQKLVAEAPIVNVPETSVNVEAPDLKPLQSSIKDVVKAVNDIVIPEYKTDNKEVEKLLKASNKYLKDILDKPVGGGGGGGGSSWVATNSAGIPVPIQLDSSGNLPIAGGKPTDAYSISNSEDTGTYKYFGFEDKNGNWYILRKTIATNVYLYTANTSDYSTGWTNRATQTYASYATTF